MCCRRWTNDLGIFHECYCDVIRASIPAALTVAWLKQNRPACSWVPLYVAYMCAQQQAHDIFHNVLCPGPL